MWLTSNYLTIPLEFMHDDKIRDSTSQPLKNIISDFCLPYPYNWNNSNENSIFKDAYYGTVPELGNHNPNE